METNKSSILDKLLTACSILYVVIPVVLFAFGWLKLVIAIPLSLLLLFFVRSLYKELQADPISLMNKSTFIFWLITFALTCIWVYLSGIGGFVFQNLDYYMRNPIYRDLCGYSWPVTYDLSTQSKEVQEVLGSGTIVLAYYFSWWLPPALLSKILSLGENGRDICLYLWALAGVFLVIYNIARYMRRTTYLIPLLFIFFGGLDVIGFYIMNGKFPGITENVGLQWWSGYFQYSSMTTLLFWVFNQAIGTWLIVILFMQLKSGKNALALTSFTLAYSPWAAVGIAPIALNSVVRRGKRYFLDSITFVNILVPLCVAAVFGLFYMMSSGSKGTSGIMIFLHPDRWKYILAIHLLFVILEVGAYFIVMGRRAAEYDFYYIVLAELLCIPFVQIISYDFVMRSTIPALFMAFILILKFLLEDDGRLKLRKRILAVLLIIGSLTPIVDGSKTVTKTIAISAVEHRWMTKKGRVRLKPGKGLMMDAVRWIISTDTIRREAGQSKRQEQVYSIGHIRTRSRSGLNMIKNQYVAYDFSNSAFFRYLGNTDVLKNNNSQKGDKE